MRESAAGIKNELRTSPPPAAHHPAARPPIRSRTRSGRARTDKNGSRSDPGAHGATAPNPPAAPGAPAHGAPAKPPEAAPGA
jgi:hypothetical protein